MAMSSSMSMVSRFMREAYTHVSMAKLVDKPRVIQAAGNKPKRIEEFIGRVATETPSVSVARMRSPSGWIEPGQTPEFDEYTLVLAGMLFAGGAADVERAAQSVRAIPRRRNGQAAIFRTRLAMHGRQQYRSSFSCRLRWFGVVRMCRRKSHSLVCARCALWRRAVRRDHRERRRSEFRIFLVDVRAFE